MTEGEMLGDPEWKVLLQYPRSKSADRRLRLFACACCRRIWHLFPDDANGDLLTAIENQPDGSFDDPNLRTRRSSRLRGLNRRVGTIVPTG